MASIETPKIMQVRAGIPWFSSTNWVNVKQYGSTMLTEFAVMASQIAVYKLAAHFLGTHGFSEYALARRTVTLIFPIPLLGLAIGLPRYIGFSTGREDRQSADRYFGATLRCAGLASLLCLVTINSFPGAFSYLFFGTKAYRNLTLPISLMMLGLCEHTIACSYFRGHLQLNRANMLQLVNLVLLPAVVFGIVHSSLANLLASLGVLWVATSSLALCFTPLGAVSKKSWKEMQELLKYGIQRVPGDFFLMALFTLPATVVAHLRGVEQAGFVAFSISLVSTIGGIFAPIGLVLLPKATSMIAVGANADLRAHLRLILKLTFVGSAAIVVLGWIAIPSVIRIYLGPGFEQVVPVARVLLFAALPYCLYLIVRNVVDAYHQFGITTLILGVGIALFLLLLYVFHQFASSVDAVMRNFIFVMAVITSLSAWECRRILHPKKDNNLFRNLRQTQ